MLVASVGVHALLLPWFLSRLHPLAFDVPAPPVRVTMIDGDPADALTEPQRETLRRLERTLAPPEPDRPPVEPPPQPPPPPTRGQVVEVPRPKTSRVPVRAQYLADTDNAVAVETRTERFKVNPDVVSNTYSDDSRLALEELLDVGAKEMSTGATAGGPDSKGPGVGAPSSPVLSAWARTNKEGLAAPLPASSARQEMAGAPQNDRLNERIGDSVELNTRAFVGAAFINRVKRMVNVYWSQQLDNLPRSTRLVRPRYETVVDVVLDANGVLESVRVRDASGVAALDACVTEAFRLAGPFPNPPAALVAPDGKIHLDQLGFEVVLGKAKMSYGGIDPRAGELFPGIQKAPI